MQQPPKYDVELLTAVLPRKAMVNHHDMFPKIISPKQEVQNHRYTTKE